MTTLKVDLKVVLLGSSNVGKTSLFERFLHNSFTLDSKTTIGVSFGLKTIKIDQSEIVLGLWDTAGQERFESLSKLYFRKASAAILCFNPSNRQSFHKAKFWYKELNKNETNCVVYLVATKIDLISSQENWVIQKEQVDNFIKKFKIKSFETSAKENIGINDLFTAIGQDYLNRSEDVDDDDEEELVSLDLRKKIRITLVANTNNTNREKKYSSSL